MKRAIIIFVMFFILMSSSKVSAVGQEVQAIVNGKIDKGENIEILINVNQIPSLFAGDIVFKYDPSMLKVKSIEPGDLITNMPKVGKFDVIKKVNEQNGTARYAFSCLGKIKGYSGTGSIVKISAQVLKKDNFQINSKPFLKQTDNEYNLKLQLCDSNIKEFEYTFKPYKFSVDNGVANNAGSSNDANTEGITNTESNTSTESNPGAKDTSSNNTDASAIPATDSTSVSTPGTKSKLEIGSQKDKEQADNIKKTDDKQELAVNSDDTTNVNSSLDEKSATPSQNKKDIKTTSDSKKSGSEGIVYGFIGVIIILACGGGYFIWRKKLLKNKTNNDDINM